MRKLKLEQFLLLLLRIIIIIVLVISFAGLIIYNLPASFFKSHSQTNLVIVLDTSASMNLNYFGKPLFSNAKEFIYDYTQNFTDKDQIIILSTDRVPVMLYNGNISNLRKNLDKIKPNDNRAYINNSLDYAIKILKNSTLTNKEILLISDYQKISFTSEIIPKQDNIDIYSSKISDEVNVSQVTNVGIESVELSSTQKPNQKELKITLVNRSKKVATVDIKVAKPERIIEQTVTIQSNSSEVLHFQINIPENTEQYLEVSITNDDLEADNKYFKIYKPSKQFIIPLLVRNDSDKFLKLAMDPFPENPGKSPFGYSNISPDEIPDLKYKFFICLNPMDFLDSIEILSTFINSGGEMICFLSGETEKKTFNEKFSNIFNLRIEEIINAQQKALKINFVDTSFPPFEFMRHKENGSLDQVDYYQLISFQKSDSIISLANASGKIVIATGKKAPGKIIIMGFSPDRSMSNLPLKPIFLPFIHNLLDFKTSEFKKAGRIEFNISEDILIKLKDTYKENINLIGKNLNLNLSDSVKYLKNGVFVRIPELKSIGFYTLQYETINEDERHVFTINYDKEESKLNYISKQEMKKIIPQINFISKNDFIQRDSGSERTGRKDLTRLFLIILFTLLLIELIFSNYISKQEKLTQNKK